MASDEQTSEGSDGGKTRRELDSDARTFGCLCHVLALSGLLIPLGDVLGPLAVWLLRRGAMPFVDHHGKEALNFQLTVLLGWLLCVPGLVSGIDQLVLVAAIALAVLTALDIVFVVLASLESAKGEWFRYPVRLPILR